MVGAIVIFVPIPAWLLFAVGYVLSGLAMFAFSRWVEMRTRGESFWG